MSGRTNYEDDRIRRRLTEYRKAIDHNHSEAALDTPFEWTTDHIEELCNIIDRLLTGLARAVLATGGGCGESIEADDPDMA